MKIYILFLLGFVALATSAKAQGAPPEWITQGPYIDNSSASFELPLQTIGTKMFVVVEIGGKPRRFVVDTGSPSMIDEALAQELGLQVVGKSQGKDSHGVLIESNIVQGSLNLGGVTFYNVPMFAADFSGSTITKCLIGDGLIGSELLPLGAWQIDLVNSVIRFNTDVTQMPFIDKATRTPLESFGYPHLPLLDVQFAKKSRSKAMFDTGSPAYFAISPEDLKGTKKAKGIGKTITGFGSPGGSLGGQAPNSDLLQAELKTLSIGKLNLGRVGAIQRESAPSLLGAGILKHFVVTLDSKSKTAYLEKYADGVFAHPSFGFTLSFDKEISVAAVWDNSPAKTAGLYPGLQLNSINGVRTELTCEGISRAIKAMEAQEITLKWNNGSTTLTKKNYILQ